MAKLVRLGIVALASAALAVPVTGATLVAVSAGGAAAAPASVAAGAPAVRKIVLKGRIGRGTPAQVRKVKRLNLTRSMSTYSATRSVVAGSVSVVASFNNRCAPVSMTLSQAGATLASVRGRSPLTANAPVQAGGLEIGLSSSSCRTKFTLTVTNVPSAPAPTPTSTPTPTPTSTPTPTPTPPASSVPSFGVQFHGTWADYTDASRATVLDSLKANDVQGVRIDVSWRMLEPTTAGQFDSWGLSVVDKAIGAAASRGLRPLVTLWMAPKWANGSDDERVAPTSSVGLAGLTDVSRRLAIRYRGVVDAWEIWNEPNSGDFMRGADPRTYASVLRAAYAGFKAGDAGSSVVFGGPMYVDTAWVRSAMAAGAAGQYDVMGVHPYQGVADEAPDLPDNGTMWRMTHVPTLHQAMVDYGDGSKKIWFTEVGWSVHPTAAGSANWQRGVTIDQQASYLARTVELVSSSYPYVSRIYWYQDRAESTDPNYAGYGLVFPNGTVAKALATAAQLY